LTNEELIKEYQEGNHSALDELIKQNENIVKFFANKYYGIASRALVDFDDLEQEGWIAFIKAVEKYRFDTEEPIKFISYAGEVIKGRMLNFINRNISRVKKSDSTSDQIIMHSINEVVSEDDDRNLEELLADESSEQPFLEVDEEIDNEILRQDLYEVLDSVFGKETEFNGEDFSFMDVNYLTFKLKNGINGREVLILHYGLEGKPQTFEQIAKKFKVTRQSVQEAEFKAIKKIRNSEAGKALMKKYQWMVFNSLEQEKDQINQFASPDVVLERMETLDDLLYGILNQCC